MLYVSPHITIQDHEIEERFVRASGPGGQNVNKVSTAVQLRFDVAQSSSLPDEVRHRLIRLAGARMTTEGVLILNAQRFRSQEHNRRDARERLIDLIYQATIRPKTRRKRKPSLAAKQRRLDEKAHRGRIKQQRRSRLSDDH